MAFSAAALLLLLSSKPYHTAVSSPDDESLKGVSFKYVVCTHKAVFADPPVTEQLAPVIGEDTTIVLIQNGVGIEEPFQARYPNNTVLSGVVSGGAEVPGSSARSLPPCLPA